MSTIEFYPRLPTGYRDEKDNWTGITSTKTRRTIQNRLNQRAWSRSSNRPLHPLVVMYLEFSIADAAGRHAGRRKAQKGMQGQTQDLDADSSGSASNSSLTIVDRSRSGKVTPFRVAHPCRGASSSTLYTLEPDHLLVLQPMLTSPKLREVWRYGVNVLYPGSDLRPSSHPDSWTCNLFRESTRNPLLFHALSWSMSSGVDLYRVHSDAHETVGLHHQTIAIHLLKQGLDRTRGGVFTDELTLAIALLMQGRELPQFEAANRTGKLYGSFRPLLQHLQWLSCVGGTEKIMVHKQMLRRAIDAKGGLQTLTFPNMAEWLQYHDIADVSHTIEKPYFALCQSYQRILTTEVPHLRGAHQSRTQSPFGFEALGLEASLENLLWDMCTYVELVELYCARLSTEVDLAQLAIYRNLIQYRLLSMQPDSEGNLTHEACRLGALVFSYGVIYPLPDRGPLDALVIQLKRVLRLQELLQVPRDMLLWLNMLGAMAAVGIPAMSRWFVTNLDGLSCTMGLSSWIEVNRILDRYLWSDQACGQGGWEVWQSVAILQERNWKKVEPQLEG